MENMIYNKNLFFAQYWGQKYIYTNEWGRYSDGVGGYHQQTHMKTAKLVLKDLSKITDEDLLAVGKLSETVETMAIHGEKRIAYFKNNIYFLIYKTPVSDFLRSQGYLLPYNGLSVEQIKEYGWV